MIFPHKSLLLLDQELCIQTQNQAQKKSANYSNEYNEVLQLNKICIKYLLLHRASHKLLNSFFFAAADTN